MTPPTWLYFPAAAAPWVPSDLTNLIAWYKADAISGLSNNDPVSTWSDSSTSGWDATASGNNRPTYITNAQNSLPIVRFSGSNQQMGLGSRDLFRNVGGGTVYAVIKNVATNARGILMFASAGPSSTVARFTVESGLVNNTDKYGAGGRRLDADSFRSIATSASINTNWRLLGAVADWTGSVLTVYLDAVQDGQDTSFHSGGPTSNTATSTTHTAIGSGNTSGGSNYDGDIAEIVVVHAALSTGDRQKLEGYLAHKWGLTGNLPGASPGPEHPYKNSPP